MTYLFFFFYTDKRLQKKFNLLWKKYLNNYNILLLLQGKEMQPHGLKWNRKRINTVDKRTRR